MCLYFVHCISHGGSKYGHEIPWFWRKKLVTFLTCRLHSSAVWKALLFLLSMYTGHERKGHQHATICGVCAAVQHLQEQDAGVAEGSGVHQVAVWGQFKVVDHYTVSHTLIERPWCQLVLLLCFHTCSNRNPRYDAQMMRFAAFILQRAEWRLGRSRDETKYRLLADFHMKIKSLFNEYWFI